MQTADETVNWLIFLQREDFSTTFTESSSCSILSKASLLSSRRVLVKLQFLKKKPLKLLPVATRHSPWARRRNPPPLGGILGTYIVLKRSLRVFQIRLFALLKWRRLAVRPHSLCEAKKPQGTHVVVFESDT